MSVKAGSPDSLLDDSPATRVRRPTRSPTYVPGALRLFFDENLSPKVARALRELGEQASGVGGEKGDWVRKGTKDPEIVRRAKASGWVIVTRNHDMLALAISEGVPFVWVDPKGRILDLFDFTLLVFAQIEAWATLLADNPDSGVIARRTSCEAIHNRAAFKIAEERISHRTQKRATATSRSRRARTDHYQTRLDV